MCHGQDLTFSLCARMPNPLIPSDVRESYLKINDALRAGFLTLEPALDFADCRSIPSGRAGVRALCFEAPSCYDLLMNGKKILGASQRRIGNVLLHQSTLFLPEASETLTEQIISGFQSLWKIEWDERAISEEELKKAEAVERKRYSQRDWAYLPEESFLRDAIFFA